MISQRDMVAASLARSESRAERHGCYPNRPPRPMILDQLEPGCVCHITEPDRDGQSDLIYDPQCPACGPVPRVIPGSRRIA